MTHSQDTQCQLYHKNQKLADEFYERFWFHNPSGGKQQTGCFKAPKELDRVGLISIPQFTRKVAKSSPMPLPEPSPEIQSVTRQAGDILELELLLVDPEQQMRTWNEMMISDHPRGAGL